MLILIAWRNIWRHPLRSLVVIGAIAFGLWGGILSVSMIFGMIGQRLESALETRVSHLQLQHPAFSENKELHDVLPDGPAILTQLQQRSDLAASGRLIATGMISSPVTGAGVQISGINPADERSVTRIANKLQAGDYFETPGKNTILIGQKLAERLKVKLRGKVVLTLQDMNGDIAGGAFRVVGIFKTSSTPFDESSVFVRQDDLRQIIGMPHEIHEIAVRLNNDSALPEMRAAFSRDWPAISVRTWQQAASDLNWLMSMVNQTSVIVVSVNLLAILFGVINTMLMAVLERTHELGMLMAVGMNKRKIFIMIVLETVFLSIAGALIGMGSGVLSVNRLNQSGVDLSFAAKGLESLGYNSIIYPRISADFYLILTGLVIIMALIASIYPARKALKLKPVEAIRGLY